MLRGQRNLHVRNIQVVKLTTVNQVRNFVYFSEEQIRLLNLVPLQTSDFQTSYWYKHRSGLKIRLAERSDFQTLDWYKHWTGTKVWLLNVGLVQRSDFQMSDWYKHRTGTKVGLSNVGLVQTLDWYKGQTGTNWLDWDKRQMGTFKRINIRTWLS